MRNYYAYDNPENPIVHEIEDTEPEDLYTISFDDPKILTQHRMVDISSGDNDSPDFTGKYRSEPFKQTINPIFFKKDFLPHPANSMVKLWLLLIAFYFGVEYYLSKIKKEEFKFKTFQNLVRLSFMFALICSLYLIYANTYDLKCGLIQSITIVFVGFSVMFLTREDEKTQQLFIIGCFVLGMFSLSIKAAFTNDSFIH